jgi:dTMP kinase
VIICIEGLDASGKNTQAKRLVDTFRTNGKEALVFSFPRYETEIGGLIRTLLTQDLATRDRWSDAETMLPHDSALILQSLMLVDKLEAATSIQQLSQRGGVAVLDRWTPSALCYGPADGIDRGWIERVQSRLPEADFYFFLDVPPEEALRRRPVLRDRYEKDREKQAVVRENYKRLWIEKGGRRPWYFIVDGTGDLDAVTRRILDRVASL